MFSDSYAVTVLMVLFVAAVCILIQKFFKKYLESDQYYYLKDITLVGAWAIFGIWAPDGPMRVTIAAGIVAACIGFCQKVTKGKNLRFLYFLVGLGFSLWSQDRFYRIFEGEYFYLSYFASLAISTLWVGIFPILFQEIDEVPGLCGLLLTVSWALVSAVIFTATQNLHDASQICAAGLVFLVVFWSRHVHAYRRLTEPLTALWGTLFAGVTIFGISNGITFYTLAVLPLGVFALPLIETALSVVSAAVSPNPTGNFITYRKFITGGLDHASSIHAVAFICALTGCLVTLLQSGLRDFLMLLVSVAVIFVATWLFFKIQFSYSNRNAASRRPGLWGVRVDNISLNYAISQVQHWIATKAGPRIIVTPDALAALRSRTDARYRKVIREAGLVLPDGAGLIAALKLVDSAVQERIPGVEFTEHLCKRAVYEGWRIWLFGGEPGVADKAAQVLTDKYPGLQIAGARNGFFKHEEIPAICREIKESRADILFVGIGVPKQEYWLADNLAATGATVGMGIGGSMDVLSGKLTRAPKIWQKIGMEWLYRTIQEPWRWRRIAKLPLFVFYVMLTVLHLDGYRDDEPMTGK